MAEASGRVVLTQRHKRQVVLAVLISAVIAGPVGYGVGRLQGHLRAREVMKERDALLVDLRQVDRLEGRRHLDLALESLDARNFGIAQEHIVAAARLLRRSEPEPKSDLMTLTEQVGATSVVPADDYSDQRAAIERLIERFDELVPPAQPKEPAPPKKKVEKTKAGPKP
jgi:hypothetical protein